MKSAVFATEVFNRASGSDIRSQDFRGNAFSPANDNNDFEGFNFREDE